MTRRTRSLVTGAVIVMLLGATLAVLSLVPRTRDSQLREKELKAGTGPGSDQVLFFTLAPEKIRRLELYSGGLLSFALEKEKGEYGIVGHPEMETDSARIEAAFTSLALSRPGELIDARPEKPETFGFTDSGQVTDAVIGVLEDGTRLGIELGSPTPSGNRYVRKLGEPAIHSMTSLAVGMFSPSMDECRVRDLAALDLPSISRILIKEGNSSIEISDRPEPSDSVFMTSLKIRAPFRRWYPVNMETLSELVKKVPPTLRRSGFVDSPGDLKDYGLAPEQGKLELGDGKKLLSLKLGNRDGSGSRYAQVSGKPEVFRIAEADLEFMQGIEAFRLVNDLQFLISIDSVQRMEFKFGNETWLFEIGRSPERVATVWKMNGNPVQESRFKHAYQVVIGLALDGVNEAPGTGITADSKPEGYFAVWSPGVSGSMRKADRRIEFLYKNEDFCILGLDGTHEFLISKEQLRSASSSLAKIVAGR